MEELRSTEVLDREIRQDAERKAKRILERADETAQSLLDGVAERVEASRKQAQEKAGKQAALYEKNVNASIPLEKERYTVSYIHDSVLDALNQYFDSLGAKKRLSVIESLIRRSLPILGESSVKATVVGVSLPDAEAMLKNIFKDRLASCTAGDVMLLADEAVPGFTFREGVILTSDAGVTCRMTLDQKVSEVLDAHSEELSNALFDGRVSE